MLSRRWIAPAAFAFLLLPGAQDIWRVDAPADERVASPAAVETDRPAPVVEASIRDPFHVPVVPATPAPPPVPAARSIVVAVPPPSPSPAFRAASPSPQPPAAPLPRILGTLLLTDQSYALTEEGTIPVGGRIGHGTLVAVEANHVVVQADGRRVVLDVVRE